jgi:hypothetical protein
LYRLVAAWERWFALPFLRLVILCRVIFREVLYLTTLRIFCYLQV